MKEGDDFRYFDGARRVAACVDQWDLFRLIDQDGARWVAGDVNWGHCCGGTYYAFQLPKSL